MAARIAHPVPSAGAVPRCARCSDAFHCIAICLVHSAITGLCQCPPMAQPCAALRSPERRGADARWAAAAGAASDRQTRGVAQDRPRRPQRRQPTDVQSRWHRRTRPHDHHRGAPTPFAMQQRNERNIRAPTPAAGGRQQRARMQARADGRLSAASDNVCRRQATCVGPGGRGPQGPWSGRLGLSWRAP